MIEPVHLRALEVHVAVTAAGPAADTLRQAIVEAWESCLLVSDEQPDVQLVALLDPEADLTVDLGTPVVGTTIDEVMELLTQWVTVEAVAARAGDLLMLHACALADRRTGRSAVMVGPSGVGKSTLAALHGRRWGYVTDETAAVTADGRLLAYPKPLSLAADGRPHKVQRSAVALGLGAAPSELQLAAVLLLDRIDGGPAEPQVEPVPNVEAIALLAEHTSFLSALDAPLQALASLLHESGPLLRVTYRDSESLDLLIAGVLDGEAAC